MAKEATKTRSAAKKPAAAKPAAAKAPAAKAPATAAASDDKPQAGVATVTFDKDKHGGNVRGAVNGQPFSFAVGKPVQVTEAQLEVLTNSGATFTVNTPLAGVGADEGSSASTTLTGTAIRLGAEDGTSNAAETGQATPELRQITDKELTGGADQAASEEQADKTAE